MIIIFDTYSGLCNQFYDINYGIKFCLNNNIKFTFRNANFRNDNLTSWFKVPFNALFDTKFLNDYELYIDYNKIDSNENNTFNFDGNIRCIEIFNFKDKDDNYIIQEFNKLNKKYIVLTQFWSVYNSQKNKINLYSKIFPSKKIIDTYNIIKNNLNPNNEPYNFLHYRYEKDFIDHFKIIKLQSLNELLTNNNFKNKKNKIYVATTNIVNLINAKDFPFIFFKNEDKLKNFNFEEKAFLDFMFGLNAEQVLGHNRSSFSIMLNNLKNTNNYY
jgi:hypothetical protein